MMVSIHSNVQRDQEDSYHSSVAGAFLWVTTREEIVKSHSLVGTQNLAPTAKYGCVSTLAPGVRYRLQHKSDNKVFYLYWAQDLSRHKLKRWCQDPSVVRDSRCLHRPLQASEWHHMKSPTLPCKLWSKANRLDIGVHRGQKESPFKFNVSDPCLFYPFSSYIHFK